jgi:16S rRNA (cytosine1402-N4)-methyltransferase
MDPGRGESVADFIETAGEDELAGVLKAFGEEPFAKRIARAVVSARDSAPIGDAATLAAIVAKAVPRKFHGKIHPATRTFQALRIHVNRELDNLHEFLEEAVGMMQAGGRIVVLAYHSLEDRIVKETFRTLARGCICPPKLPVCGCGRTASLRLVTRGAMRPEQAEVEANPASRSARMRAGEKL